MATVPSSARNSTAVTQLPAKLMKAETVSSVSHFRWYRSTRPALAASTIRSSRTRHLQFPQVLPYPMHPVVPSTPRSSVSIFCDHKGPSESSCGSGYNCRHSARSEEVEDHVNDGEDRRVSDMFSLDSRTSPGLSSRRTDSTGSAINISTTISLSSASHSADTVAASHSSPGFDSDATPRASLELSIESSAAYHPALCSEPVSDEAQGEEELAKMEFVSSSTSSFRTATPTPSSVSNGTSVRSIVDLPMNAEEDFVGFSAFTRSRSSHHTWISGNTQDIMSPDKPGESPPGNHRQHRSMYDKPSRPMIAAFSKASQEKRPGTASSSSSSSRLADSIERIWRSKSYSYTDSRSSKGARSSVYDPELGVRILVCYSFQSA